MTGQAEDVGGDAAHDYDVVVVGAGPAGSTAAGYLAKHGHSVLLLEGERFPRFHLAGPELSRGLFAAVSGDAEQLLKDFEVVGVTSKARSDGGATEVAIRLVPKVEATRKRLRELIVTLRAVRLGEAGIMLRAVSYRDHSGDQVEIELRKVRVNAKDAPTVAFDVPKDTRIIEHQAGR